MKAGSLYLDVCALSRPFDDQDYLRIKLETEAVNLILSNVKKGGSRLLFSPVHVREIEAIEDTLERTELLAVLEKFGTLLKAGISKTRARAEELLGLGFGVADAAHVAFAEQAGASFVSCDDRLIKKCRKHGVGVWCGSPIAYCEKEELR
ncbi:MAG: hypothetical protein ACUZ8A_06290 [Candidatus Bathyanammoxibius sp.]